MLEKSELKPDTAEKADVKEGRQQEKGISPREGCFDWDEMTDKMKFFVGRLEKARAIDKAERSRRDMEELSKMEEEQVQIYGEQLGFVQDPNFLIEIAEIAGSLTKAAGFEEDILVLPILSNEVNAFVYTNITKKSSGETAKDDEPSIYSQPGAMGRHIFLCTGLVTKFKEFCEKRGEEMTKDDLAFVLSHELRHLIQQRQKERTYITRRQEEYDADLGGMDILGRAGFNPREAVKAMEFLCSEGGGYSDTHPASASRLVEISKRIADPDMPFRGLGAVPKKIESITKFESRSVKFAEVVKTSPNLESLIVQLTKETDSLPKLLATLPLACSAIRYAAFQEIGSTPCLESLFTKYLYQKGIETAKFLEEIRKKISDANIKIEELEAKENLNNKETVELRNLKARVRRDEEEMREFKRFDVSNANLNPKENDFLQAWEKTNVKTEKLPMVGQPTEEDLKVFLQPKIFKCRSGSKELDFKNLPDFDWAEISKAWIEGGEVSSEISEVLSLGMWAFERDNVNRERLLNKKIPINDLGNEASRRAVSREFAINFVENYNIDDATRNYDKDADPDLKIFYAKFDNFLKAATTEGLKPIIDKIPEIVSKYLPSNLSVEDRDRIIKELVPYVVPMNTAVALRYPQDDSWSSRRLTPEQATIILEAFPSMIFDSVLWKDNNLKAYDLGWGPNYEYFFHNTGLSQKGQISVEVVDRAKERLMGRLPKNQEKIRTLDEMKKGRFLLRGIAALEFCRDKINAGVDEVELKQIVWQIVESDMYSNEQIAILLRLNGIRNFEGISKLGYSLKEETPLTKDEVEKFLSFVIGSDLGYDKKSEIIRSLSLSFYGFIKKEDLDSRILSETCLRFLHRDKDSDEEWLTENLKGLSIETKKPIPEILGRFLDGDLVINAKHLQGLATNEDISAQDLRTYYRQVISRLGVDGNRIRENIEDFRSGFSGGHQPETVYLEKLMVLIAGASFMKDNPELSEKIYKCDSAYQFKEVLEEAELTFEQITEYFPESSMRNGLLMDWWRGNNFEVALFDKISPFLDKKDGNEQLTKSEKFEKFEDGRNVLSFPELIKMGENLVEGKGAEEIEDSKSAFERYNALKAESKLIDYGHSRVFGGEGYLGILEKKYGQDPGYFINSESILEENLRRILDVCPPSGFRDYLISRAFKIELWKKCEKKPNLEISPLFEQIENEFMRASVEDQTILAIVDKLDFPATEDLKKLDKVDLIRHIRAVIPHIEDEQERMGLGRWAFELLSPKTKEEEFKLINEFFSEPSFAKDHYLKNYMLKYSLAVSEIKGLEGLLTQNLIRNGNLPEVKILGAEIERNQIKDLSPKTRSEYLSWLLGINEDPPMQLILSGGVFGFDYGSVKDNFFRLTNTEKTEFLREFVLFEGGLFQPKKSEEEKIMTDFIGNVYDKKLADGATDNGLLREIFINIFDKSIPEKRHLLFTSLLFALEKNKSEGKDVLSSDEKIKLMLEQTGVVGIKVGQVLSESANVPFSNGTEKMSAGLKETLSSLKDGVGPFNIIGAVYRLEDNGIAGEVKSIDKFLATASIKQAHAITTERGAEVLKVRRPSADKYIEHDQKLLESSLEIARAHGKLVPKYFSDYVMSILKEESDFRNEAENQKLLSQNISQSRGGWEFRVPDISYASSDLMIEKFASGKSLSVIKKDNPKLYKEISALVGIELLSQFFEKGVYHADLHDGNVFVDEESKKVFLIDAGAVGDARNELKPLKRIFRGLIMGDSNSVAASISQMTDKQAMSAEDLKIELVRKLKPIMEGKTSLEEKVQALSFEILDQCLPNKSLRYFLKAMATGAHHLDQIMLSMTGKEDGIWQRMRSIRELGPTLVKVMFSVLR